MKRELFILGICLLVLSACEDVIELDLPDAEPLLVVNGRITDSDSTGVTLTTSAPYFSNQATPRVSGAVIRLFENGVEIDQLAEDSAGYYRSDQTGIAGRTYHITVEIAQGNPAIASGTWRSRPERLRPVALIDSVYSEYLEEDPPFQEEGLYPFFTFSDLADQRDHYRLRIWRNDTIRDAPTDITTYEDELWNGRSFDNVDFPAVQFENDPKPEGTTYRVEQSSISVAYFDYLNLMFSQTAQVGSTFDPPPAPLIGNIECLSQPDQIGLGYFNVSAISTAEVSLEL